MHVPVHTPRTTPRILLLNRQMHQEATSIIYKKPLTMTKPGLGRQLPRLERISYSTYAKIPRFVAYPDGIEKFPSGSRWAVCLGLCSITLEREGSHAPFELHYGSKVYIVEGAKLVSQH